MGRKRCWRDGRRKQGREFIILGMFEALSNPEKPYFTGGCRRHVHEKVHLTGDGSYWPGSVQDVPQFSLNKLL